MDVCESLLARATAPFVRAASCALRNRRYRPTPSVAAADAKPMKETTGEELDALFLELQEGSKSFSEYGWKARADLARECIEPLLQVHNEIAAACGAHKGTAESGLGEELLGFCSAFNLLRQFADGLDRQGKPTLRGTRDLADNRIAVRAFPTSLYEHLLFPGWKGEVWVKSGAAKPAQAALISQRIMEKTAPICVQLAAGNQAVVVVSDVLEKIFGESCVCLVKMNPVNEYLGPILERGLAPLVRRKLLHFAYGPATVAKRCIEHSAMQELHITGSDKTYNQIQWGSPLGPNERGELSKSSMASQETSAASPKVTKPFTAELGACTPYIICPGRWSEDNLRLYARTIVSMKAHNAGCNCLSPQILVTCQSWPQRSCFLDLLHSELKQLQPRTPWYPGAVARLENITRAFPTHAEILSAASTESPGAPLLKSDGIGLSPWVFVPDAPVNPPPKFLRDEFFSGAFVEVTLDSNGGGHQDFLRAAVDFANDSCWGTLSCSIFVPPDVPQRNVDEAVDKLRYGSVNVNTVTAFGYAFSPLTWGAYPGHKPDDIQSGMGIIHNTLFLDAVEKSVLWAPFGSLPYTDFVHYNHANPVNLGRRLAGFMAWGNLVNFVKTTFSGLRG